MGRRVRFVVAFLACTVVLGASARVSVAQDARHDVIDANDFRVRLAAALTLGKTKPPDARPILEKALKDPHPAVRTAAAAALAALGDSAAVPALQHTLQGEANTSVQTQLRSSIASLQRGGAAAAPRGKYVVQLGNMRNGTPVRGEALGNVLRSSARERAQSIPGAVVVQDNAAALRESQEKHLPVLVLDGTVTRMGQQPQGNGAVGFSAAVEFSVRKIPEHTLKASLSGAATSIGTASSLGVPARVSALQDQAVDGAVESALRNADRGLSVAAQ